MAEGGGFGFAEGAEFAGAALHDGAGDFVCESCGFGAVAYGEREDVEIVEGEALNEGERGCMVSFGFAREAGDDVGADGGLRGTVVDECDAAGVVLGTIRAMHGGEDAVGGGLQGHVEVLGDAVGGGEEIDEVLGDVEGLDGADAEALDGCFAEDAAEEIFEFDAGGEIAAVGAEVDAAENDFAVAGFGEAVDFSNDFAGWQGAASAANKRDDAVGTAGGATVLDLERGAGGVRFSGEGRGGREVRPVPRERAGHSIR